MTQCNCVALRQAARLITQFYDAKLESTGLTVSQFSLLAVLNEEGPLTIAVLAEKLLTDRTTMGRNISPVEREGLVAIEKGQDDARKREVHITSKGLRALKKAAGPWREAQESFAAELGEERLAQLRSLLESIASLDLGDPARQWTK